MKHSVRSTYLGAEWKGNGLLKMVAKKLVTDPSRSYREGKHPEISTSGDAVFQKGNDQVRNFLLPVDSLVA